MINIPSIIHRFAFTSI